MSSTYPSNYIQTTKIDLPSLHIIVFRYTLIHTASLHHLHILVKPRLNTNRYHTNSTVHYMLQGTQWLICGTNTYTNYTCTYCLCSCEDHLDLSPTVHVINTDGWLNLTSVNTSSITGSAINMEGKKRYGGGNVIRNNYNKALFLNLSI